MKHILLTILFQLFTTIVSAENDGFLYNRQMIVQTQMGTNAANDSDDPYGLNRLKKWEVRKEGDPVAAAIKTYKNKKHSANQQNVWIVDKSNPTRTILLEYGAGASDKVLFTPAEDFAFYVGTVGTGTSAIFGLNLATKDQFKLGAGTDFFLQTCPDRQNYVVVQGTDNNYTVYNSFGKKVKDLNEVANLNNLNQLVCY